MLWTRLLVAGVMRCAPAPALMQSSWRCARSRQRSSDVIHGDDGGVKWRACSLLVAGRGLLPSVSGPGGDDDTPAAAGTGAGEGNVWGEGLLLKIKNPFGL